MSDSSASTPSSILSATLAPLVADSSGDSIKRGFDQIASLELRYVQVSAMMPGLRPRDLDLSARRDLLASLRRRELQLSGLDAWIPAEHFADPATADRAATALLEIIGLAADLGRSPVSVMLPGAGEVEAVIVAEANKRGVDIADHALPLNNSPNVGLGIDPAACVVNGLDPAQAVHTAASRLVSARIVDLNNAAMRGPIDARSGRVNVMEYKVALAIAGYRKPVIIDSRQWSDPLRGIQQTINAWNAV